MSGGVTHYDVMKIPPPPSPTRSIEAGAESNGVEYRLLNDAIAAAHVGEAAVGNDD